MAKNFILFYDAERAYYSPEFGDIEGTTVPVWLMRADKKSTLDEYLGTTTLTEEDKGIVKQAFKDKVTNEEFGDFVVQGVTFHVEEYVGEWPNYTEMCKEAMAKTENPTTPI
jgi:hypothetical protein